MNVHKYFWSGVYPVTCIACISCKSIIRYDKTFDVMCNRIETSVVVTMGFLAGIDIISTFYNLCLLLQLC